MADLETQNPQDQSSQNNRNAGDAQLFKEENMRGRINGSIVMPDEPSFAQPKNGIQTDSGSRLTFETNPSGLRVKKGNDESVDAGYF